MQSAPAWATRLNVQLDSLELVNDRLRKESRLTRMTLDEHFRILNQLRHRVGSEAAQTVELRQVQGLSLQIDQLVGKLSQQQAAACGAHSVPPRPEAQWSAASKIAGVERVAAEVKAARVSRVEYVVAGASADGAAARRPVGKGKSGEGACDADSLSATDSDGSTSDDEPAERTERRRGEAEVAAEAALCAMEAAEERGDALPPQDAWALDAAEEALRAAEEAEEAREAAHRRAQAATAALNSPIRAAARTASPLTAASRRRTAAPLGSADYYRGLAGGGSLGGLFDDAAAAQ